MALGATARDVVLLVVRQAAWPVVIGLAIGSAASFGLTRVLTQQLFGVQPNDPLTLAAVIVSLAAVALLASSVPARARAR
jgi:ABC-type antimicrobial peptide transport system permease subunit